jgi:hypothetical protein
MMELYKKNIYCFKIVTDTDASNMINYLTTVRIVTC